MEDARRVLSAISNSKILIIAYGNPLRCDDGIAWRAAEQLTLKLPSVAETICVHQLTPELAEKLSEHDVVAFLDAAREGEPGSVACKLISATPVDVHLWHHLTPENLLALSKELYGAAPRAFSISLCGELFDHGEMLSPSATANLPRLVATVTDLLDELSGARAMPG
jgi:hydrogenase maturation protease